MRSGYKLTEVGVIPENWDVSNLQDACGEAITYGIVQCGPHVQNGVPYVRVTDMDRAELDVDGMLRTTPAIAARFSRSTVSEGDLIYALRGKLGEVRIVSSNVAGANLTQGTARISPREGVYSKYLMWAMRDSRAVKQAEVEAKGTTFREITLADLRRISIPLPGIIEQRAIADALSDVDVLIRGLECLIEKKLGLKQAAMQQLLTGQTRLPSFSDRWERLQLGEIAITLKGHGLSKSALSPSGVRPCLLYGELFTKYGRAIDHVASRTHSLEGCASVTGDVLMPGSTTTSGVDLATASALFVNDVALGGDINIIRARSSRYNPIFLAYYLSEIKRRNIVERAQGVTIHHLYGRDLLSLQLDLPSREEQTAIACIISDLDGELAALEARREKTCAIKQGMMQELLTGRTRLV